MLYNYFKANFKIFIYFLIILIAFIAAYMFSFNSKTMQTVQTIVNILPDFIFDLANFNKNLIVTPEGYFGTNGLLITYIFLTFFVSSLVNNIITKDFSNKIYNFVLTKPFRRLRILLEKLFSIIIYELLISFIIMGGLFLFYKIIMGFSYTPVFLHIYGFYSFVFQIFITGVCSFLAMKTNSQIKVILYSMIISISFYTLFSFKNTNESIAKLSPFYYMQIGHIIVGGNNILVISALVITSALLCLISFFIYKNKEMCY